MAALFPGAAANYQWVDPVEERLMHLATLIRLTPLLLSLGLCVATEARAEDTLPRDYGVQRYTPKNFRLPDGTGCAGDVARWQAVQANDYASGNVNLRIYDEIQGDIARAAAACEAGRDAEARKLVATSKARHGYPQ